MEISEIISLCSGIALFLFGMTLMGDGLKRVAGNKLELVLFRLSSTTLRALLLGTGVTGVIQSSVFSLCSLSTSMLMTSDTL